MTADRHKQEYMSLHNSSVFSWHQAKIMMTDYEISNKYLYGSDY